MDPSTILNFLKIPKRIIFVIFLICALLLFSSDEFLTSLAVLEFKNKYTLWFGIVFIFSLAVSVINISDFFIQYYKKKQTKKEESKQELKHKEQLKERIQHLDDHELSVIREFLIQKKNTLEMSIDDPTVIALVREGVLEQVGNQGYSHTIAGHIFYFKLSEIMMTHINNLDFKKIHNKPSPSWINNILAKESYDKRTTDLLRGMM